MTYRNNNVLKIYEHVSINSREDASICHTWPCLSVIFITMWKQISFTCKNKIKFQIHTSAIYSNS